MPTVLSLAPLAIQGLKPYRRFYHSLPLTAVPDQNLPIPEPQGCGVLKNIVDANRRVTYLDPQGSHKSAMVHLRCISVALSGTSTEFSSFALSPYTTLIADLCWARTSSIFGHFLLPLNTTIWLAPATSHPSKFPDQNCG